MYAIIKTGGKQYTVTNGSTLLVEKIEGNADATIELTEVLMIQDESGLRVGTPMLAGVKVIASIVEQTKGKKINGFTFKPKKSVSRRYGHRQQLTRIRISSIEA